MATATATWNLPNGGEFADISAVEDDVKFVGSGVKVANRTPLLVRMAFKATLYCWLRLAVRNQRSLINHLNGPAMQKATPAEFSYLATEIVKLVELNDELQTIASPRTRTWPAWMEQLAALREQRDTLESIAESFRAAADPVCESLLVETLEKLYA